VTSTRLWLRRPRRRQLAVLVRLLLRLRLLLQRLPPLRRQMQRLPLLKRLRLNKYYLIISIESPHRQNRCGLFA
jgi:hypothetical protein